jgi:hypothetical protein
MVLAGVSSRLRCHTAWSNTPKSNALLPKCQWRKSPYREYATPKSAAIPETANVSARGEYEPFRMSFKPCRAELAYALLTAYA